MSLQKYTDRDQRRRIRLAIKAIMTKSPAALENALNLQEKPVPVRCGATPCSVFAKRKNCKRLTLKL